MTGYQKRCKHVPERSCIACRRKRPKWEMVRIVCTPQGSVEIDSRGKKAGRGAYLCRIRGCWEIALRGRRLEHALKAEIQLEKRTELAAYGEALPRAVEELEMAV